MLRLLALGLLVVVSTACSPTRVIRLDLGQGAPREYTPPTTNRSVAVDEDDLEDALERWVLEAPLPLRSPQQGWLVRTSTAASVTSGTPWHALLRKSFGDVAGLGQEQKLAVALGLSIEPMRESIVEVVKDTLTPQFFYVTILTGMVTWVALAANPEPVFTKAAAVVAVVLLAYLGVDAFLEVVKASLELKRSTDQATTFEELEGAGQRFAQVVGPQGARVFILAVTMLVSRGTAGGGAWLASRMPLLPRFAEASALGASQVGFRLEAVEQVRAVAVVEGQLVISLAPTAVAMAAMGPDSGSGGAQRPPSGGPGRWEPAEEFMSEGARQYQAQVTGAPEGHVYKVGGVKFDGYKDGVLLEAKGPGYTKFFKQGDEPEDWFQGAQAMIDQARRQTDVAEGIRIEWHFAEREVTQAMAKLFRESGLGRIRVVHTPATP